MRRSMTATFLAASALLVFSFQNCSQGVAFQSTEKLNPLGDVDLPSSFPPDDVVCDPLNPESSQNCSTQTGSGLIGNLYYLTAQFIRSQDDLSFIRTSTFRDFGVRAPVQVLFNSIDVSPRSWEEGFTNANGQTLVDNNGKKLVEWFSVDLNGRISLPKGEYQFATVSDDGIVISMNGQTVIADDSRHAPSWKCDSETVTFGRNEQKTLRVKYWQGPRTQIAMQLLVRPASEKNQSCDDDGGWEVVPPEAFSH